MTLFRFAAVTALLVTSGACIAPPRVAPTPAPEPTVLHQVDGAPEAAAPRQLLQAPQDGVAYHAVRQRTQALAAAGDFVEAEPLAEQLVRDYPRDGMNWYLLGRVKRGLNRHDEAAAAFERAGPLMGWGPWYSPGINAAMAHAAGGNIDAAIDLLEQQLAVARTPVRRQLWNIPQFAALRNDPRFQEIAGRPDTSGWTRTDGWRRDIEFLYREVKRVNPTWHGMPFPAEFERRYDELLRDVPRLTDEEIYVGINRMLAVLRQGHLWMFGFPDEKRAPVVFYAFQEGLHVIAAMDPYSDLIGARVLRIGNTDAEDALSRVNEILSVQSDMEYLLQGPTRLRQMPVLVGLGIASSTDSLQLVVQTPGGAPRAITVEPQLRTGLSSNRLLAPPGVPAPLYLQNAEKAHWEHALPEHDALYVQLNNVRDDPDETLAAFGRRLWTLVADDGPRNLILDVRHNDGGILALAPEFTRTLIAFSRLPDRRLYILIGRRTYSAAANLITDLERLADPIFVGEQSSQCCELYGDFADVVLPYSGISGAAVAVKWKLTLNPWDGRQEISPHVPVTLSAADHFGGRDPALESVFRLIHAARQQLDGEEAGVR